MLFFENMEVTETCDCTCAEDCCCFGDPCVSCDK